MVRRRHDGMPSGHRPSGAFASGENLSSDWRSDRLHRRDDIEGTCSRVPATSLQRKPDLVGRDADEPRLRSCLLRIECRRRGPYPEIRLMSSRFGLSGVAEDGQRETVDKRGGQVIEVAEGVLISTGDPHKKPGLTPGIVCQSALLRTSTRLRTRQGSASVLHLRACGNGATCDHNYRA